MNIGTLLAALSALLYGSIGFFGSELASHGLSISDFLFWRFFFSALILSPCSIWLLRKPASKLDFRAMCVLFTLGALLYGSSTSFYYESSQRIGTGLGMVIFFAYPICVVALSIFINRAPFQWLTSLSLLFIVVGGLLISLGQDFQTNVIGIILAILSGIAYGLYIFFSKSASAKLNSLQATFIVCLGAATGIGLHMFACGNKFYWPTSTKIWVLISLFSLVGTVLPVLLLLASLKTLSANRASIISALEPFTTLVVGVLILHESITFIQYLGAFLILASAIIVQLEKDFATH